jgi:hypothetical protein
MLIASLFVGVVSTLFAPMLAVSPAQAATRHTWERLAHCESGGRWHINTGNGYYGGLQFSQSTWRSFGGHKFAKTANHARKGEQIRVAKKVKHRQGWSAWPSCSHRIGVR